MTNRYIVRLSEEEREELKNLISKGKSAAYKIKHANILLAVDTSDSSQKDEEVAQAYHCHRNTVANVRKRFVMEGIESALGRQPRQKPSRQPTCDGHAEAKLIALRCSEPPEGHARWTLRLLADKAVELEIVPAISHETVRQVLKKTN